MAVIFVLRPAFVKNIQLAACTVTGVVLVLIFTQLLWTRFPCYEMEDDYAAPLEYWIALGSVGNGGYGTNESFAIECLGTLGKDAKRVVAREHMAAHWEEIWSLPHWISKMRYNFASGNMGLSGFVSDSDSAVYELFNDYGKYGGYMTMFTTGYFYALLIFGIMGCWSFLGGRIEDVVDWRVFLEVVTALTVLGIILFLMLWEANNRQLYNHMPWFALLGAMGCDRVLSRCEK